MLAIRLYKTPSRDCLKKRGDKGIAYASVHEKELPYQPY